MEHFFIKRDIVPGGHVVGKVFGALLHDTTNLQLLFVLGSTVKQHGLFDRPHQSGGIVSFEQKAVAGMLFHVKMADGVMNATGIVGNRQGAVDRGDHLRQAAGFKPGRHQDKISGPVSAVLQVLAEIANRHAILKSMEQYDITEDILIIAVGNEDNLKIAVPVSGYHPV